MFWRFGGYANVSTIDTILEKDNFQLEELLDETDLIQELKQHNAKLIEYLREPKVLEKLLQYVVAPKLEPVASQDDNDETEDEDEIKGKGLSLSFNSSTSTCDDAEKKRNRYAFVAAEILSADVWSLYEALLESRDLLVNFWQFLTRPSPLDPLQASYFTKVNESLFDKKTAEMIDLLKSMDGAVANLLRHVDCPMIMDLLLKIISLERNEAGQGIVEWLYSQDLMPTLISFLGPEHPWSTQTSAADFIKAIITVSANASQNEQACIGPNELTRQLVSRPCVEQLIKYMLGGGNPLTCGVGIVIEVIRKNNSDYDPEGVDIHAPPTSKDPIYLGTLLRLFAEHIPDFMNLIMTAPAQEHRLNSTFGDRIEPLGFDRFKTCELMAELLHCSNMVLLNEPGSEEFIAARDAERHRLRAEGKLMPTPGAAGPMRRENLSLQASQLSAADENRKLEVTNSSVEDDGFEEVSHAAEEEITHGVLELPDAPLPTGSSLLDKDDDDFVDEPLSSPRLKYSEPVRSDDQSPFEDPDLVVPPLSPKKQTEQDSSSGKTPGPSGTKEEEKERPTTMVEPSPAKPVEEKPPPKTEEIAKEDTPSQPSETAAETTAASQTASEGDSTLEQSRDTIDESVNTSIVIANITEAPNPVETTPPPAKPVVGDFLKMQLVKYNVVPTILSFFFKYPWNNFLHNVVYDIVQQVFNGPMDRGYNPTLATSLFEQADITTQIINGQKASEKSEAEIKTRQGYMGHLTLIAEEVVKFTERHPPELLSETVLNKVMAPEWVQYVEGPLAETRERDNAILGGVRPEAVMARGSASLMGFAGLSSIGLSASASNALAEAGLNGGLDSGEGSGSLGAFSISAGTLMSGFGSSSDEDDDEEQETEEDVNNEFRAYTNSLNSDNSNSLNPPSIPPPPPPPPPLNIPPSRARLQLAARLAMNKRNAEAAAQANEAQSTTNGDPDSSLLHEDDDDDPGFGLPSSERISNPFEDYEEEDEDEEDVEDNSSDDGDPSAAAAGNNNVSSSSGLGWNRGSWWRNVVRRGARRFEADDDDDDDGLGLGRVEKFGDGRDDSSSSDDDARPSGGGFGTSGGFDDAFEDEEFGDFAMPEVDAATKAAAGSGSASGATAAGGTIGSGTGFSGIDPERETILVKPTPVHAKSGIGPFSSFWPFSTPKFGLGEDKEKEKEATPAFEKEGATSAEEAHTGTTAVTFPSTTTTVTKSATPSSTGTLADEPVELAKEEAEPEPGTDAEVVEVELVLDDRDRIPIAATIPAPSTADVSKEQKEERMVFSHHRKKDSVDGDGEGEEIIIHPPVGEGLR